MCNKHNFYINANHKNFCQFVCNNTDDLTFKELVGKWQQFVNSHLEFESGLSEAIIWLDTVDDKLTSCNDFKSTSKADLEEKLIVIQVILYSF